MSPHPLRRVVPLAAASLLLLSACGSILEPVETRLMGTLVHYGNPVSIQVPDSAAVGVPFEVRMTTFGGGCESRGDTEALVGGRHALIIPYDNSTSNPDGACPDILHAFEHQVALSFESAGDAQVTVRGRKEPGGDTIEFTFQVRVR